MSSMSSTNKLQKDRNQKLILELASLPGNNICADCKARNPRWASYSLGIFICMNCASIHRGIGTHITKVKSLTMDIWSNEQIEFMKSMGNAKSNAIYNPNEFRHPPPPNLEDTERDSEIEQYIRSKYETKRFIDRSALVASRLGPSRSASSVTPRSVTAPMTSTPSEAPPPTTASSSRKHISPSSSQTPQHPSPLQHQAPTRSVSQPVPPPAQASTSTNNQGGVWDDIQSLASQNSSLPLQYQTTSSFGNAHATQQPYIHGALGSNGYPVGITSMGTGINPFQPQRLGTNPFAPPQLSPFSQPTTGSPFAPQSFPSSQTQPSSAQYLGSVQERNSTMAQPTTPLINQPTSASFYQPQPQGLMQAPPSQTFLTPSPSQPFIPSPSGQPQFLTPSPSQQMQPSQLATHGQFSNQNPAPPQPQMQFGSSSGQGQFLGMTTMQMQQQQLLQQQQQQQQLQQQLQQQQQFQQQLQQQQQQQQQQQLAQNIFNQGQPQMQGYGFPQGSYSTQAGQWGSM